MYCDFKNVARVTVVGLENTLDLEVHNGSFNKIKNAIDGYIIPSIGIDEFTMSGFLSRSDYSQSDVALIPNITLSIEGLEESRFRNVLRIMKTTRKIWGTQAMCPAKVQATCRFTSVA